MTTYRTRPGYFRADDSMAQKLENNYREAFDSLPPDVQDRLREGGEDRFTADQLLALMKAPHPLVTMSYWVDRPEGAKWHVAHEFARWAEAQERIDG